MIIRAISAIVMILLIALAPWWVAGIAALAALIYFHSYIEIILWGIMIDALYGPPNSFIYTLAAVVLFLIAYFVKRHMRERSRRNTI